MLGRFFDDILFFGNRKLLMTTQCYLKYLSKRFVQISIAVIVLAVSVNCVSGQCEIQKLLEPGGGPQDRFGMI